MCVFVIIILWIVDSSYSRRSNCFWFSGCIYDLSISDRCCCGNCYRVSNISVYLVVSSICGCCFNIIFDEDVSSCSLDRYGGRIVKKVFRIVVGSRVLWYSWGWGGRIEVSVIVVWVECDSILY